MRLILLSSVRAELILLPEKIVCYNKMSGYCYTENHDLNMQIAVPVTGSLFYERLYRTNFSEYHVVYNENLNLSLVFLYGKNPAGELVHLVFMCPSNLTFTLLKEGMTLNQNVFLGCGLNFMPDLSLTEKTVLLFDQVKGRVNITSDAPHVRIYRFTYIDDTGVSFHQSYQSTVLELVQVDEVSQNVEFTMGLQ
ncbi:hypothetical protein [Ehrlichia japonica]|uniref:Uncharacterized protein n=1 Tax=Ehrlichia japonica TaxID=391036 RepID=X5H2M3_9RICK|nr:hypothetical protein [Ehrlichia japonica]AHX04345.1 hypothetical protein EHF_0497 [Ehrlichia japonica]